MKKKLDSQRNTMLILKFGQGKMVSRRREAFNDTSSVQSFQERYEKTIITYKNLSMFCDTAYQIDHCLQFCFQCKHTQALCGTITHTYILN